ncbi:oligosaccharide flippase family protein [Sphingomonas mali]|uniref:oligosaccharide flippase family protein n=1 Tax=Sphingomonas mali TaxID=40682 RepID=UPI000836A20B|nr:oligosaccharide flippase family protein [Sphingomonas mali]
MNAVRKLLSTTYWLSDSPIAAWLRGAGWLFASSLIERAAALVQTVMIARAIGIENYGRYALLFSTISLLTPLVGLQLPYAIIYFVSRYQAREPERAGAVVLLGRRLTAATTGLMLAIALLFANPLSAWLFAAPGYAWPLILGAILLMASIQAGLNDTLLQANERFRTLAIARLSTAIISVVVLIVVARLSPGLTPVMIVLAGSAALRWLAVAIPARSVSDRLVAHSNFREAIRQGSVILQFSLPSGTLAFAQGIAMWIGNYYLTRSPYGLRDLAVINTGLQWRSPILVVMASLASALLPMLGRYIGQDDHSQTQRLQRYNMILNVGIALVFSVLVILFSSFILKLYGRDFHGQAFLFGLFLIVLVPTVYCNVHQQYLVATGRMWTQCLLFVPYTLIIVGGTMWFAPGLRGIALGYIQLLAWVITAVLITVAVSIQAAADRKNQEST